jgi:hypothetical protein
LSLSSKTLNLGERLVPSRRKAVNPLTLPATDAFLPRRFTLLINTYAQQRRGW